MRVRPCDRARDGLIAENTVYKITSYGNPAYGNQYAADGIYVDGGTRIVIERNRIYQVDLGIEMASEHSGKTTDHIIARNNLVYFGNSAGISIGGYASGVGGSDSITIVNNSLLYNDRKNTGSGEFQIQFHATNNVFKNNIAYATKQGLLINNFTKSEPDPADVDFNVFNSSVGTANATFIWNGKTYTGFTAYRNGTSERPRFVLCRSAVRQCDDARSACGRQLSGGECRNQSGISHRRHGGFRRQSAGTGIEY